MIESNIGLFADMLNTSKYKNLPFVKYWLSNYFAKYSGFGKYKQIQDYLMQDAHNNLRNIAQSAISNKKIHWVRTYKNRLNSVNPWDKRAIMFASLAMSKDERKHWMKNVEENSTDISDILLAKYLKNY